MAVPMSALFGALWRNAPPLRFRCRGYRTGTNDSEESGVLRRFLDSSCMRSIFCRAAPGKDSSLELEALDQFQQRRKKLTEIEALGHASYPHKFAWTHTARQVAEKFGERTAEQLAAEHVDVRVAGRVVALRPHGKAAFGHF